jgi:hypothetical protein
VDGWTDVEGDGNRYVELLISQYETLESRNYSNQLIDTPYDKENSLQKPSLECEGFAWHYYMFGKDMGTVFQIPEG